MLNWRLKQLPSVEEVERLIEANIITKEEARSIFFKDSEKPSEDDLEEIKHELSLIRKMITNIPTDVRTTPIIIREIEKFRRYERYPWFEPYGLYCSTAGGTSGGLSVQGNSVNNMKTVN